MKKLRSRSVDGDHHQIICLFFCVLSLNSGVSFVTIVVSQICSRIIFRGTMNMTIEDIQESVKA